MPVEPSALLTSVSSTGSPSFPDIFAYFSVPGSEESILCVRLHTAALREISHRLDFQHAWGRAPEKETSQTER